VEVLYESLGPWLGEFNETTKSNLVIDNIFE